MSNLTPNGHADLAARVAARKSELTTFSDYEPEFTGWTTYTSHPASGLAYQETVSNSRTVARVVQDGREIVSPTDDDESVYRQYNARVQRWIDNH